MKIAICVKPVPDLNNLLISKSRNTIIEQGKRILNPYDLPSIGAATKISTETTAIMVGANEDMEALRKALSLRISDAILINYKTDDHFLTSRLLGSLIKRENFQVVFCGSRSQCGSIGQVPVRLAEELGFNLLYEPSNIAAGSVVKVHDNCPSPSLPSGVAIMQAFRKNIKIVQAGELLSDLTPAVETKASYLA